MARLYGCIDLAVDTHHIDYEVAKNAKFSMVKRQQDAFYFKNL